VRLSRPDFRLLLPDDARQYRGISLAGWFLAVYATIATIRSCIHIMAPDGGASSIAGLNVQVEGGANVVAIFGQWGVEQLLIAASTWLVVWRYRGLIPAALTMATLDQLLRLEVGNRKPVVSSHTPPGAYGSRILLPFCVLALVLSVIPRVPCD
jgi:hypothetical protein